MNKQYETMDIILSYTELSIVSKTPEIVLPLQ